MNSLVAYGSDDETDQRYDQGQRSRSADEGTRRQDDTNYDDVTMDMSEDSNNNESDRELPPADEPPSRSEEDRSSPKRRNGEERRSSSPRRDRRHGDTERDKPSRREREKDRHGRDRDREHRDDRRGDRSRYDSSSSSTSGRRGLLGDKPEERSAEAKKVPALMDLKPFGGEAPPAVTKYSDTKDARDSRASEKDRREPERERERDRDHKRERDRETDRHRDSHRDKDRHSRRSPDRKRGRSRSRERRSPRDRRERSHDRPDSPPHAHRSGLSSVPEFRTSYKVSKKLQVMEKMGLQIKTPDGSMATAQQLMQRTVGAPSSAAAAYFKPGAVAASLVAQVEKRKLLWSKKSEGEAEIKPVPEAAAKWTGTKFSQDTDGKVANKFMRLMGIKQPEMVKAPAESDVNEKQERMFQDMQAQYDVARATTHTMRGVGLGFQRHL